MSPRAALIATRTVKGDGQEAKHQILNLTGGRGVDTAIEAVGIPATFELCQDIIAPGGIIANIGVHGAKADLHLETLWARNIAITTRLVDTVSTPMLLKTVQSGEIDPSRLITHRFELDSGRLRSVRKCSENACLESHYQGS